MNDYGDKKNIHFYKNRVDITERVPYNTIKKRVSNGK